MLSWIDRVFSTGHVVSVFLTFLIAFAIGFFWKNVPLLRSIIIDEEGKTVRGSFINCAFTILIGILIGIGAFRALVADNLMKMETLIIGVFAASFGIYSLKQGYTAYLHKGEGKPPEPSSQ